LGVVPGCPLALPFDGNVVAAIEQRKTFKILKRNTGESAFRRIKKGSFMQIT
jgi:hypothetical protein